VLVLTLAGSLSAGSDKCVTIQSGTLLYQPGSKLAGQPIKTGVDPYGYNYQAHSFNGSYFNAYANRYGFPPYDGDDAAYLAANPSAAANWAWPYRAVDVAMKWNDAWLSNQDCNGDGKLDRPDDSGGTYVGSGAWLTNHNAWTVTVNGKEMHAEEFTKIVANPVGVTVGAPYNDYFGGWSEYLNGTFFGIQIWGDFAVIQEVLNDPSMNEHGLMLKSEIAAGFGLFKP
jgi:hypothetical protein